MSEETKNEQVDEAQVDAAEVKTEETTEAPEAKAEETQTSETAESDLRDGLKVAANNPDAIDEAESAEEEEFEEQFPSFFVEEDDRQRVEIDILHDPKSGKIVSVAKVGIDIDYSDYNSLRHSREWLEFKPPTYDNMAAYRQGSTLTTAEGKRLIDRTSLRNFLLVRHLKDWSFRDRNGEKVELSFKDNGALDEKSIEKVYSVPPIIIDVILTIFEKDILLT